MGKPIRKPPRRNNFTWKRPHFDPCKISEPNKPLDKKPQNDNFSTKFLQQQQFSNVQRTSDLKNKKRSNDGVIINNEHDDDPELSNDPRKKQMSFIDYVKSVPSNVPIEFAKINGGTTTNNQTTTQVEYERSVSRCIARIEDTDSMKLSKEEIEIKRQIGEQKTFVEAYKWLEFLSKQNFPFKYVGNIYLIEPEMNKIRTYYVVENTGTEKINGEIVPVTTFYEK